MASGEQNLLPSREDCLGSRCPQHRHFPASQSISHFIQQTHPRQALGWVLATTNVNHRCSAHFRGDAVCTLVRALSSQEAWETGRAIASMLDDKAWSHWSIVPQALQQRGWLKPRSSDSWSSALSTVPFALRNFLLIITEVFQIIHIPYSTCVCLVSGQWAALTSRWLRTPWVLCACLDSDPGLTSSQLSRSQLQTLFTPPHWCHGVADCSLPAVLYLFFIL